MIPGRIPRDEKEDTVDDNQSYGSGQFWTIYLAIIGVVLLIGWKQPIRYRFLSKAQIEAIEHPPTPEPAGSPTPRPREVVPNWMWDPNRKTSLDRSSYNQTTSPWGYRYTTPIPYYRTN